MQWGGQMKTAAQTQQPLAKKRKPVLIAININLIGQYLFLLQT